jgi:hypothetical protein
MGSPPFFLLYPNFTFSHPTAVSLTASSEKVTTKKYPIQQLQAISL